MNTITILKNYKELIDKELELFFNKKIEEAKKIDASSVEALELLKDYTLRGGKRIRAAMMYYGYACFKEPTKEVIKASMAMELVQSYLLIHDDIIDNDNLRRGKDTIHVSYQKLYKEKELGKSLAIILGDVSCCLANEIIAEANFNEELKNKAINEMNKVIKKVCFGQILDILGEIKKDANEGDVLFLYKLKSATYTIEGPLHIGTILAGADEDDLKILSRYAVPLGLAFQIRDDINGTFGEEEKTGKSNDSDIKQGKRTLMMLRATNQDEKTKEYILSNLGKKDIKKEDIERIKKILKKNGSLDYCIELSNKYVQEAIGFIKNANFREEGKEFLINIANYIANREN